MKIVFEAKSINESFARMCVAAFASQYDPKVSVIADIKTVISEAVTNSIVHGYREEKDRAACLIYINCCMYEDGTLLMKIRDRGCGIQDVKTAMQPLFTTDTEGERSGMGFTIMESFTDGIKVTSKTGKGTTVKLIKKVFD